MQKDSSWDSLILSEVFKTAIAPPVNIDENFEVRY
jgi:hypothetical protein